MRRLISVLNARGVAVNRTRVAVLLAVLCGACTDSSNRTPVPANVGGPDQGADIVIDLPFSEVTGEPELDPQTDEDAEIDASPAVLPIGPRLTPTVTTGAGSSDSYRVHFSITQPITAPFSEGDTIRVTPAPAQDGSTGETP